MKKKFAVQLPFGTYTDCKKFAIDLIAFRFTFTFQEIYPQFVVTVDVEDSWFMHEFESIVKTHNANYSEWS